MENDQSPAERSLASYKEAWAARSLTIEHLHPSSVYEQGHMAGAQEEREAVVRLITEDPRLQGWRMGPIVESYRRLLLDLLHAGEDRK